MSLTRGMAGKTVLITGATDGIGKHTAFKLAKDGATVFIHGRNREKCQRTLDELKLKTQRTDDNLSYLCADLSSFDQIRDLSQQLHSKVNHLDLLINNAGVFDQERKLSEDGFEMTFAVNVLAPYLLSGLVLDLLKRGRDSRILIVSSISQTSAIDFANLQYERGYDGHSAYELSKTCDVLLTYELADRLRTCGSDITANCLDPGTVNTNMLVKGWGPIGIPVEKADYEYDLATNPQFAKVSGSYFVDGKNSKSPPITYEKSNREKLWATVEELTNFHYTF